MQIYIRIILDVLMHFTCQLLEPSLNRKRSIIFTGPLIWNQLNPDFHILPSVATVIIL